MNQICIIWLLIYVVKEFNIYFCVVCELIQKFDYEFSFEEIVELLDWFLEDVKRMFGFNEWVFLVDMSMVYDLDKLLLDIIVDIIVLDFVELLQDVDFCFSIDYWLDQLLIKQCEVIVCRFGLCGYEMSILEEVGLEIGLICEWVRQIQVEVLKWFWDLFEKQGLIGEFIFGV